MYVMPGTPSPPGTPAASAARTNPLQDADKDLISTLEAEIKHEESEEVELPRAPPNGFTVESQPGVAVMVWTRKIGAETIRVQSNVSEQEVFDDGFQARPSLM